MADHNAFLPDRPSLLVQDLQLQSPADLFTFEGTHMVAAGRGVTEFKMDSVWIGSDTPMAHKIQLLWRSDAQPAMHNLALQGFMEWVPQRLLYLVWVWTLRSSASPGRSHRMPQRP